ncbi:MAG: AAA family ATPase [Deltaproteobacteria bacterium]|nr:AAA family ATPase [Deltaproteobacteria bacterium]
MQIEELSTVLEPKPLPNFVETKYIRGVTDRALAYIEAGFPVHFRGTSGTGKTTLAMHVAARIGRPVVIIHGDEEMSTSDMVGGQYGYRMRRVVDNFIHTVLKSEEDMKTAWVDNRLTTACKHGFTLIYDEFTRSRPEANNILLSILQEKMMGLPAARGKEGYLKVHPNFVAIFTSKDIDYADRETEASIVSAKSGWDARDAEKIVDIVRGLRDSDRCEFAPTVRACIIIAKTLKVMDAGVDGNSRVFRTVCADVLSSVTSRAGNKSNADKVRKVVEELIDRHCLPVISTASELDSEGPESGAKHFQRVKNINKFISDKTCLSSPNDSIGDMVCI